MNTDHAEVSSVSRFLKGELSIRGIQLFPPLVPRGRDSVPRDIWATSGAIFSCHSWGGRPAWSGWGPQRVTGRRVDSVEVGRPAPVTGGNESGAQSWPSAHTGGALSAVWWVQGALGFCSVLVHLTCV